MSIDAMIEATIGKEGGYSDHPNDKGGPTCWGITQAVARANGYTGDMKFLPRDKAVAIYRNEYLIKPGFAAVAELSERIAEELFDTGVNMGQSVPILWLQQWLNAFNFGGKLYPDIPEAGGIGPKTLGALRAFLVSRGKQDGEAVMLRGLNCSQGQRYLELARGRMANESFVFGWLRTRVNL